MTIKWRNWPSGYFNAGSYWGRSSYSLEPYWIAMCHVNKKRNHFIKHLQCEAQKANFQLLIVGFCCKFSTLVSECATSSDKQNRKAVAMIKMLVNFQVRKATQGWIIIIIIIFISLFLTANFTGYSRLFSEDTSRNHQAYKERPPLHHKIVRNKGCEEVRLN